MTKVVEFSREGTIRGTSSGLRGVIFPAQTPKFVINKETNTLFRCDGETAEVPSIGFSASGITRIGELNEIIRQLQTLANQMSPNFTFSKEGDITDLHRIDQEESSTQKE